MTICNVPGCTEHYGCSLRAKGLQVTPSSTPRRHNRRPFRKQEPPAYNKQIAGDRRPDGSFMPYRDANMTVIGQKQFDERSRELTSKLREVRSTQTSRRA